MLSELHQKEDVDHYGKTCHCGKSYGYNYSWLKDQKINTVKLRDVDALFVTSGLCFTTTFLEYHGCLQFRGFIIGSTIMFCVTKILYKNVTAHFDNLRHHCQDAKFLRIVMSEFEKLPREHIITIGNEVSSASLKAYDALNHAGICPLLDASSVTEFACDGHEKVTMRRGAPRALAPGRGWGNHEQRNTARRALAPGRRRGNHEQQKTKL